MTDAEKRAEALQHVALVNSLLRQGFPAQTPVGSTSQVTANRAAADQIGWHPRTFADRVGTPERTGIYERQFGLKPDWGALVEPDPIEVPPHRYEKPRIRVKAISDPRDQPVYTVLAVGDFHDKPELSKERATWIGRLAAEKRPDRVVSIGDWADLGSLSTHEAPGSAKHAAMTTFADDLESLDESLSAFHRDLPVGSIPVHLTLGNHENRAWRAANADPKRCSDMPLRVEQAYARYRWQTHPFGQFLSIGGCSFVHVPLNIMGREMGGRHLERSVANDALSSVIMGHTHRRGMFSAPKVGQGNQITCLNLGTAMPTGYVAPYAKLSVTGWSYGVYLLRLRGGVIISEKFWDMDELQEVYGD